LMIKNYQTEVETSADFISNLEGRECIRFGGHCRLSPFHRLVITTPNTANFNELVRMVELYFKFGADPKKLTEGEGVSFANGLTISGGLSVKQCIEESLKMEKAKNRKVHGKPAASSVYLIGLKKVVAFIQEAEEGQEKVVKEMSEIRENLLEKRRKKLKEVRDAKEKEVAEEATDDRSNEQESMSAAPGGPPTAVSVPSASTVAENPSDEKVPGKVLEGKKGVKKVDSKRTR
jgi:hypothetical protein